MTQEERSNIAKLIRRETCCGLMEAATAVDKLIYALKHGPSIIMDKPRELEVTWKERIASDLDAAYQSGKADMKKQMMREAVEYEVGLHGEPIKIAFDKYVQRARGIFPGDKIKIIIVNED